MVLPFVVALVENKAGAVLLGRQPNKPHKPYPGFWDLPGGKLEPNETPEECIIRELKEETGFEVAGLELLDVFHNPGNDLRCKNGVPGLGICYKAEVTGDFKPAEMDNMHWVSRKELKTLQLVPWAEWFLLNGEGGGDRTHGTWLKRPLLYH